MFEGIQSMAKTSVTKSGKWGGGSEREKLNIKEEISCGSWELDFRRFDNLKRLKLWDVKA